jgi:HEAT repeat protein
VEGSAADLSDKLERALEAENLEGALYRYRLLFQLTGVENREQLGRLSRLALLRDMRRGPGWIAIGASGILARHGEEEALDRLLALAADRELFLNLRRGAVVELGKAGDPRAAETLLDVAADSTRPMVERLAAYDALLAVGDVAAVHPLALLVRKGAREDRVAALRILRHRNAPAKDALHLAMQDPDEEIRLMALEALAQRRDPEALRTLRELFGERPALEIPMTEMSGADGAEPEPVVDLQALGRRLRLARALLEAGDAGPGGFVAAAIRHPNLPYNRGTLAAEVARVDRLTGNVLLGEVLESGTIDERIEAAGALLQGGQRDVALAAIEQAYNEAVTGEWEPMRILALGKLAGAGGVPASGLALLRRAAAEDDVDLVRIHAAHALAGHGEDRGLTILRGILETAERTHAQKAAEALLELAQDGKPERR